MIPIKEQFKVPATLDEVWPLISNPALVASCIPGATFTEQGGDGLYRGNITIRFGPTVAVFRGETALHFDHENHLCKIDGRGIDKRGASRATASFVMTATGTTTTAISIDGNFNVSGPLETFANAGGLHVARALIEEFSANLAGLIEPAAPPVTGALNETNAGCADAVTPAGQRRVAPAKSLRAGWLLWRILRGWLGSLDWTSRGKNQ
jgi:uncharacterized protein